VGIVVDIWGVELVDIDEIPGSSQRSAVAIVATVTVVATIITIATVIAVATVTISSVHIVVIAVAKTTGERTHAC
jgi:hypothetical protein